MTTREELYRLIENLTEEQLRWVLEEVKPIIGVDPFSDLRAVPGLKLPEHWPPRFGSFEPMTAEGDLPSRQLIRVRR